MGAFCIKNGQIYDGTGAAPFLGDIWIAGERIVSVQPAGTACDLSADETIDAAGRVVCPGFIDMHRHHDVKPLLGWSGEVELRQGITTAIAGNCGISLTPAAADPAPQYTYYEAVLGPVPSGMPRTYPEYISALQNARLPLNVGAMPGTGTVRISVNGFARTPLSRPQLDRAAAIIDEALQCGAPGVSMGIMYLPECYGTVKEFVHMLKPLGRRGGILTVHIRGEGDSLVNSVKEVIEIARRAGCALEISHFKACGLRNWRRLIFDAIDLIEAARAEGMNVGCDFYPYDGGSTALTTLLPPTFVAGDMDAALRRLATPEGLVEFTRSVNRDYPDWDNSVTMQGWGRIVISGVYAPENKRYVGMSVERAAEDYGFSTPEELAAQIMYTDGGRTAIISMSMCQDDIDTIARLPYSAIISDAIYADTDTPHPRMFGAMPKALREYVAERHVLTMEDAIYKMTALPARRMGIEQRGELKPGAFADILMFDPRRFTDRATYADPAVLSEGLALMLINGKKVIIDDAQLCNDAGVLIKRSY